MQHVMLDLETLGTGTRAAIVQIGACEWTFEDGPRGRTFCESISLDSCLANGLVVDGGALRFWLQQSREVIDRVFFSLERPLLSLYAALENFAAWLPAEAKLWGNGALFDNRLLIEACAVVGVTLPVTYRDHLDVRTLVALARAAGIEKPEGLAEPGLQHDALVDAVYQAEYCSWMARKLLKR